MHPGVGGPASASQTARPCISSRLGWAAAVGSVVSSAPRRGSWLGPARSTTTLGPAQSHHGTAASPAGAAGTLPHPSTARNPSYQFLAPLPINAIAAWPARPSTAPTPAQSWPLTGSAASTVPVLVAPSPEPSASASPQCMTYYSSDPGGAPLMAGPGGSSRTSASTACPAPAEGAASSPGGTWTTILVICT